MYNYSSLSEMDYVCRYWLNQYPLRKLAIFFFFFFFPIPLFLRKYDNKNLKEEECASCLKSDPTI